MKYIFIIFGGLIILFFATLVNMIQTIVCGVGMLILAYPMKKVLGAR